MLRSDGGDLEIVDIKDTLVYCRLIGACEGCPSAGQTLRMMVERTLKEMVDERVRVIEVWGTASGPWRGVGRASTRGVPRRSLQRSTSDVMPHSP